MMMDANNCVILLNGLEDEGLIARTRDPEDRRRHIVAITPKGYRALEKAERKLETLEDDVLGNLDQLRARPAARPLSQGARGPLARDLGLAELEPASARDRSLAGVAKLV